MTLRMIEREKFNEGKDDGENLLGKLMNFLLTNGKTDEALIAITDAEARKEIYKKYGIID